MMKENAPSALDRLWICPQSMDINNGGRLKPDYAPAIGDAAHWPHLLAHTAALKLYIEGLSKFSDDELATIARVVRECDLKVAVELGGCRMAIGSCPEDMIGERSVDVEWPILERFLRLGGRVDYITTDHALAETLTGRSHALSLSRREQMDQQMRYFSLMRRHLPQVRMGSIESLGFFWTQGEDGRMYEAIDPKLDRLDLDEYLTEYLRAAERQDVELDHFHIDYGMEFAVLDGDPERFVPGYGRILGAEALCRRLGLHSGFVAANAFHRNFVLNVAAPDEAVATRSAVEDTLRYFSGYRQAGGAADVLIFQRWQPYPAAIGPTEDTEGSQLWLFRQMLDQALADR